MKGKKPGKVAPDCVLWGYLRSGQVSGTDITKRPGGLQNYLAPTGSVKQGLTNGSRYRPEDGDKLFLLYFLSFPRTQNSSLRGEAQDFTTGYSKSEGRDPKSVPGSPRLRVGRDETPPEARKQD